MSLSGRLFPPHIEREQYQRLRLLSTTPAASEFSAPEFRLRHGTECLPQRRGGCHQQCQCEFAQLACDWIVCDPFILETEAQGQLQRLPPLEPTRATELHGQRAIGSDLGRETRPAYSGTRAAQEENTTTWHIRSPDLLPDGRRLA